MTRQCSTCKENKELTKDFFCKKGGNRHGLNTECKLCASIRTGVYQKSNRIATNLSRKAREAVHRQNNKCLKCGNPPVNSASLCEKHFLQFIALRHVGSKKLAGLLMNKLIEQNYKCAYTGIDIKLGINASIDHIKSRVKFPELQNDPDNVHWVDIKVNLMKRELTEGDFFEIITLIYNHRELKAVVKMIEKYIHV